MSVAEISCEEKGDNTSEFFTSSPDISETFDPQSSIDLSVIPDLLTPDKGDPIQMDTRMLNFRSYKSEDNSEISEETQPHASEQTSWRMVKRTLPKNPHRAPWYKTRKSQPSYRSRSNGHNSHRNYSKRGLSQNKFYRDTFREEHRQSRNKNTGKKGKSSRKKNTLNEKLPFYEDLMQSGELDISSFDNLSDEDIDDYPIFSTLSVGTASGYSNSNSNSTNDADGSTSFDSDTVSSDNIAPGESGDTVSPGESKSLGESGKQEESRSSASMGSGLSGGPSGNRGPGKNDRNSRRNNPFFRIRHCIGQAAILKDPMIQQNVYTSAVRDIDTSKIRPKRSGVIVYTTIDDELVYCMGIDTKSGDLTDFGGGVKYRRDQTAIWGGLREFTEESLSVFGAFTPDQIQDSIAVYSSSIMVIFLHLEFDYEQIDALFRKRVRRLRNPEVSSLVWIPKMEMSKSLSGSGKKMYSRVRRLLNRAPQLTNLL